MLAPVETTNLADDEQDVSIIKSTENISKGDNMENRMRINNESKIIVFNLDLVKITKLGKFCEM